MADFVLPAQKPLIAGDKTPADVTREICHSLEGRPTPLWWGGFLLALSLLLLGAAAVFGTTLMLQQDTKPTLQSGDPASSVLNRVEYGNRT